MQKQAQVEEKRGRGRPAANPNSDAEPYVKVVFPTREEKAEYELMIDRLYGASAAKHMITLVRAFMKEHEGE